MFLWEVILPTLLIGFLLGYGVREVISRRRHAKAQRNRGLI